MQTSEYVLVGSPEMNIPIPKLLLEAYPGYAGNVTVDSDGKSRIVTGSISYPILSTLHKVLTDLIVIPTMDLSSHYELTVLIGITRQLGIPDEKLYSGSFKGWTEHRKWTELRLPEYMWCVYSMIEELVDFRKYIRLAHNPFEMVVRAIELPEIAKNSETLFDMMIYFSNFKLELCFDMNNDKVQAQIARLRVDLDKIRGRLLINPHDHMEFFSYTPPSICEDRWSCRAISAVELPKVGQCTIVDNETVMTRFREFTCGLLDKPLNPLMKDVAFPWENVAFAGGGATKILSSDYEKKNARQSDVDLFVMGESFEIRKKILDLLLDWFNTFGEERSRSYYATRGSVITIYIKGVNRKIQIISSNAKTIYDVIGRFDLTHIQWAYWNGRYYGTPQAADAMRSKLARFSNIR